MSLTLPRLRVGVLSIVQIKLLQPSVGNWLHLGRTFDFDQLAQD